jgi:aspartate/methionine/tyrosine aminotransferase
MFSFIRQQLDRVNATYYVPDGGTVVVVKLPANMPDDVAFVQALRAKYGVQVTAGSFFRLFGHVRLAYMNISEERTMEGVRLFANFYAECCVSVTP